jgi:hypothetical protein
MMSSALIQRWPMSEEKRRNVIEALLNVIQNSQNPREITAAARALIAAEGQNQSDEHKVIDIANTGQNSRFAAIAQGLGIDPILIDSNAGEASRGVESAEPNAVDEARREGGIEEAGHVIEGSGGGDSAGGEFGSSDSLPG